MSDPPRSAAGRPIRSYVLRAGRLTPAQARALTELAPHLAAAVPTPPARMDLAGLFGRRAPLALEIGCGNGEALCALARAHPEQDFLGAEVYPPGVGHLLGEIDRLGLGNVRVARADARAVLGALPTGALDAVYILFPDPWPKKRHHKRRLVDDALAAELARCLKNGGTVRLATDAPDYAAQMRDVLSRRDELAATDPLARPETKYERRARRLGNAVTELAFERR